MDPKPAFRANNDVQENQINSIPSIPPPHPLRPLPPSSSDNTSRGLSPRSYIERNIMSQLLRNIYRRSSLVRSLRLFDSIDLSCIHWDVSQVLQERRRGMDLGR
jgi:hypothetical protein